MAATATATIATTFFHLPSHQVACPVRENELSLARRQAAGRTALAQYDSPLFGKLPYELREQIWLEFFAGHLSHVGWTSSYPKNHINSDMSRSSSHPQPNLQGVLCEVHELEQDSAREPREYNGDSRLGESLCKCEWTGLVPSAPKKGYKKLRKPGLLALPLTCKRINDETISALYESTVFECGRKTSLLDFAYRLAPQRYGAIRKLQIKTVFSCVDKTVDRFSAKCGNNGSSMAARTDHAAQLLNLEMRHKWNSVWRVVRRLKSLRWLKAYFVIPTETFCDAFCGDYYYYYNDLHNNDNNSNHDNISNSNKTKSCHLDDVHHHIDRYYHGDNDSDDDDTADVDDADDADIYGYNNEHRIASGTSSGLADFWAPLCTAVVPGGAMDVFEVHLSMNLKSLALPPEIEVVEDEEDNKDKDSREGRFMKRQQTQQIEMPDQCTTATTTRINININNRQRCQRRRQQQSLQLRLPCTVVWRSNSQLYKQVMRS